MTNLFDSLNRPLVHEHRFDLTQKINDNFKDLLGDVPGFLKLENQQIPSFKDQLQNDSDIPIPN